MTAQARLKSSKSMAILKSMMALAALPSTVAKILRLKMALAVSRSTMQKAMSELMMAVAIFMPILLSAPLPLMMAQVASTSTAQAV